MDTQSLLLDLFCCAGGASRGYANAGFRVVGVDIKPRPHYPYPFIQADAIGFLDMLLDGYQVDGFRLGMFDAIHASPPCQSFSGLSNAMPGTKEKYPNLIPSTRERLRFAGKPYVIENVVGSPLDPTAILCGSMFGKRLRLHRLFETNFSIPQLACDHSGFVLNPYNQAGRDRIKAEFPGRTITSVWKREKDVEWMNGHEASEAIMPVFTEYVGAYMMRAIRATEVRDAA
jgi:DNA (cytosine-5)-methyltransferase 1